MEEQTSDDLCAGTMLVPQPGHYSAASPLGAGRYAFVPGQLAGKAGGLNVLQRSLNMKRERRLRVTENEKDNLAIAGFEHERRPQAKECRQPLEAGKDTKMDSPLESPGL